MKGGSTLQSFTSRSYKKEFKRAYVLIGTKMVQASEVSGISISEFYRNLKHRNSVRPRVKSKWLKKT